MIFNCYVYPTNTAVEVNEYISLHANIILISNNLLPYSSKTCIVSLSPSHVKSIIMLYFIPVSILYFSFQPFLSFVRLL